MKIASSANPHVDVETALEQMRKAKIFDGEGNFRFKNKFRPQNLPIFLCQPAESSAADLAPLVLLIADPSVTDRAELAVNSQASIPLASTGRRDHSDKLVVAQDSPRRAQLRRCGFNTLSIAPQEGAAEMTTDSWAERDDAHIFARARDLADLVEAACPELAAQTTLPFSSFMPTPPAGPPKRRCCAESRVTAAFFRRTCSRHGCSIWPMLGCKPIPCLPSQLQPNLTCLRLLKLSTVKEADLG